MRILAFPLLVLGSLIFYSLIFSQPSVNGNSSSDPREIQKIMKDFRKEFVLVRSAIQSRKAKMEIHESISRLKKINQELKGVKQTVKDKELLIQYCEAIGGVLSNVGDSVNYSFWDKAMDSLSKVHELEGGIRSDFIPGPFNRLRIFLSNIFFRRGANQHQ